jgi:hypothetical protein
MPSSISHHESSSRGRRLAALWAGLAAGPLAWAVLLETNYALSYVACEQRHTWMLHLAAATALLLIGLGALAARAATPSMQNDAAPSVAEARARFMAVGGLILCAWFAVLIVATEIPVLILHPCTL